MIFEAWAKRTNRCGALILEILWLFHIYVTLQEGIVLWKQWRWLSSPFFPSLLLPNSGMTIFFLDQLGGTLKGYKGVYLSLLGIQAWQIGPGGLGALRPAL